MGPANKYTVKGFRLFCQETTTFTLQVLHVCRFAGQIQRALSPDGVYFRFRCVTVCLRLSLSVHACLSQPPHCICTCLSVRVCWYICPCLSQCICPWLSVCLSRYTSPCLSVCSSLFNCPCLSVHFSRCICPCLSYVYLGASNLVFPLSFSVWLSVSVFMSLSV